ncbi:MAG: ABC transporter substrate-binding protein [Vicinamibacterales bacterium]|nr:ABC transporter substrate-binding protein [Vicinamibacterales bacterium]
MEANYWERLVSDTTSSRRRFLTRSVGVGSGIAMAAVIGCGGSSKTATPTSSATQAGTRGATAIPTVTANQLGYDPQALVAQADYTPPGVKRGGTWTMRMNTPLNDVKDPHKSAYEASWIQNQLTNRGLYQDNNMKIVPELFASWEQVSPTQLILKTQPGAKWQNKGIEAGRAFTAEDAAYNLMRIAGLLDTPANLPQYQRATTMTGMTKAEAVDNQTVRVTFSRPTSTFLAGVSDYRNNFLSKERLVANNFKEVEQVGTGPFIITKWDNGVQAYFDRNPDYWKKGRPWVDHWELLWIVDFTAQAVAFQQGKLSTLLTNTKVDRGTVEKLVPNAIDHSWQFTQWTHIRFQTQKPPFNDDRVRKALFLVPDYVDMGNAAYGDKWSLTGPLPNAYSEAIPAAKIQELPGFNPKTKEADIKTAVQLMTAAGYPDGAIKVGLMTATTTGGGFDDSIRTQSAWKKVWPKMDARLDQPPDPATESKRRVEGDFDANVYNIYPQPDAVLELDSQYGTQKAGHGSRNYGKISDAKADDMLDKAYTATVAADRAKILLDLQNYLLDKMYTVTLAAPMFTYKYQPNVRGMLGTYPPVGGGHVEPYRQAEHVWFA